jgi:hypothetical protein
MTWAFVDETKIADVVKSIQKARLESQEMRETFERNINERFNTESEDINATRLETVDEKPIIQ